MTADHEIEAKGGHAVRSCHPPCPNGLDVDTDAGEGAVAAAPCSILSDGLAVAQHAVAFAQRHSGIVLTTAGRDRLEEVVVGLVAQLEGWASDPMGGPPDPWTYLRRRWHRQHRLGWWGTVPATTRRVLTGIEPRGRDSLLQIACQRAALPRPAVVTRWRTGLLDFDPASDMAAARRLAVRRASRRGKGSG